MAHPTEAEATYQGEAVRLTLLFPVSLLLSSQMQFSLQLRASVVPLAEPDAALARRNPLQNSPAACPQMIL